MESLPFFTFYYILIFVSIFLDSSIAVDTITPAQTLIDGETLVSSGQSFELGFFSPGDSNIRYLGIWYKKFPDTVVWVANREKPVTGRNGVLCVCNDGNLVLLNQTRGIIWSSNSSRINKNPVVQLLESGNLVLRDKSTDFPEGYTWQSFDFPGNTHLPGMRFGRNLETGQDWYLTSWRNASDPSPGNFTYRIEIIGLPQVVLRNGSEKKFRSGPWNGLYFNGMATMKTPVFKTSFAYNASGLYFWYRLDGSSRKTRLNLNEMGSVQRFVLGEGSMEWDVMYTVQNDQCDNYGRCGANSICRIDNRPICDCLDGFVPVSENEWEFLNWTSGCIRRTPLDCQKGEGFIKLKGVKLPDLLKFWVNKSMTSKECERECLKSCSCTAYTNSNISRGGSGCLIWFGDLIDVREFTRDSEQVIYIRMPASELDTYIYIHNCCCLEW